MNSSLPSSNVPTKAALFLLPVTLNLIEAKEESYSIKSASFLMVTVSVSIASLMT
jgi:hypothetical protein